MGVSPMRRDHVPFLQRIRRRRLDGPVHHHALHALVELQVLAQRRILERLQIVVHGGLAVVVAVGNVLQEQIDFLVRE